MSPPTLNLARRPFQNLRPIGRLTALLWLIAAFLMVGNVWFFGRYAAGAGTQESTRAELQERIGDMETGISELEREIGRYDLPAQNAHVEFLNSKIGQRVFGWSRLFDRLSDVLPNQVRLTRLSPDLEGAEGLPREQHISLHISGAARSGEDLLKLVDALFRHPRFRRPYLASEATSQGGEVEFRLSVEYQPAGAGDRRRGKRKSKKQEVQEETIAEGAADTPTAPDDGGTAVEGAAETPVTQDSGSEAGV